MENPAEYLVKPQIIKVALFDTKSFEIIEGLDDIITLHEKHIEFKWKCHVKETEDGIAKEKKYRGNKSLIKVKIICVGCAYIDSSDNVELSVYVSENQEYTVRFKTFSEALKVKEQIMDWLIK